MLDRITAYFTRLSTANLVFHGFLMIVLVGVIDYFTGRDFSVFLLYLVPVSLVTSGAGRNMGFIMAAAGTSAWFLADILASVHYRHPLSSFWNAGIRMGIFSILVVLQDAFYQERISARTDSLTRLGNRKAFYEAAEVELERLRRYGQPLSLAYIDLDNFKAVNDRFGHKTGDRLLRVVSAIIRRNIRKVDATARLGGDEFAVLLPQTDSRAAGLFAAKLKNNLQLAVDRHDWPATFSIGVVTYAAAPASVDDLVSAGDTLMYEAKREGKDRIRSRVTGSPPGERIN